MVLSDETKAWLSKIRWQLISFKFLSFWAFVIILVGLWFSLESLHVMSIDVAKELYTGQFIDKVQVTTIITTSQEILYNKALSHILTFIGAILAAIIAIKGVSYWTESSTTKEALKKVNGNEDVNNNLRKFLKK